MQPLVSTELDAVRIRRAELREALNRLEQALAAPAFGRAEPWGTKVDAALTEIAEDFVEHIAVTEGPGGLHLAILSGDLRLANAVDALTAEHLQISEEIAGLLHDAGTALEPGDVNERRERCTRLLGHLIRHRQRGADLIYEAYQTDIGGGD